MSKLDRVVTIFVTAEKIVGVVYQDMREHVGHADGGPDNRTLDRSLVLVDSALRLVALATDVLDHDEIDPTDRELHADCRVSVQRCASRVVELRRWIESLKRDRSLRRGN